MWEKRGGRFGLNRRMEEWSTGKLRTSQSPLQAGTARKRSMVFRELQNIQLSESGSDPGPNEFIELEKGRMKRECHRAGDDDRYSENWSENAEPTSELRNVSFDFGLEICKQLKQEPRGIESPALQVVTPEPNGTSQDAFHFTSLITPSLFMKQKLRLELMERDLATCQDEKVQLQKQLQASLQTAFRLQELIMKQKMVVELEQVANRDKRDQAQQWKMERDELMVQRDELRRKLDEAVRAREEAELTLSLSRDLNSSLFPGAKSVRFELPVGFSATSRMKGASRRLSCDEHLEILKQSLDEKNLETEIFQTVTECVYAGSLWKSEAGRVEAVQTLKARIDELERLSEEADELRRKIATSSTNPHTLDWSLATEDCTRENDQEVTQTLHEELKIAHVLSTSNRLLDAVQHQLEDTRIETTIYQLVIETVYKEAFEASEGERMQTRTVNHSLLEDIRDLNHQILALQEKVNSCEDTVELPDFQPVGAHVPHDEDRRISLPATPLKLKSDKTPIKFFRSKRVTSKKPPVDPQNGSPWICRSTTLDLTIVAKREAALSESLKQSMQEKEMLGGKVEEHKAILEKITLLMSYMSKTGYSAVGSKQLAREICDQLEQYHGEIS